MQKIKLFRALESDSWIKPFLKQYRKTLLLAIFLGFLTFFSAGALMFNSGYLISRAASLPENILMIYIPIVLTRAFGISRPVFRYIERLVSHNWVLKMTSKLRLKLYQVVEQDAIFFQRHYRMGDILGLLAEDINHIQNLYLRTIFPTIIAWLLYVFIIIGLGFFSVWFALVMLLLLGIVVILLPMVSVLINGARQSQLKQLKNQLYPQLTDNVLGIGDWIFSQRTASYLEMHERLETELRQTNKAIQSFNRFRDFIIQLIFGLITISLLYWTSSQFIGVRGGKANWIAAFVLTVFPLIDAFAPLSNAAQETNSYSDSIRRFNDLPEISARKLEQFKLKAPFKLAVDQVNFKYTVNSKLVLNQFSLTINQGEKIGVLGKSGAGKSTLATLLRGDLQPTAGQISLNGVPTTQFGEAIADYIGVIQQKPYLFHTTIANNIRIGQETASDEAIIAALQRVGLGSLIDSLPDGIETMVDEAGLRFSGGERHRLALARILLKDVPIIILDEPTVGLDPITEQALLATFFEVLRDKTIIWITHHLQGIELMDRVIFIEAGRLVMNDSPQALEKSNPKFQQLRAIDLGLD
ncbi:MULTISPECIES: thiol reductant ABC exporter subunit CydC [unclassified Enterococcus]|uniref:thiol reductant ABC exporter subunit CydC n=1 Tax=unclassified Enterococcus TaxID=2608891 RepID=UPI00155413B0|nr:MULTISPECIES: thiol reductant ABC exporter subunit CydC [unclassified Enterococcus]MBS7577364.1 thiol reductant ABC exporter subunit CydC [Enterococcus sp. MMGLQ5-2]MBS7584771.1 thiol reductant ABC exporter subunit CydC [Enterococcus sp. MMGLQ5-1]NPD12626.1 thiol reductant ABC exporter subunit CydC [Enterococcus sp. MMGLQ5-1]NPD37198.1 thiol reductant ABC exporter subunit CydC [Enterococcus sp. MMGLQ5-2]